MSDERKRALLRAADTARFAPSIHNTQPWRWVVHADRLELFGVAERRLAEQDPQGHMLLLSCGTALHHARVALDAEGWTHGVEMRGVDMPGVEIPDKIDDADGEDPYSLPLAVIRPIEHRQPDPAAARHVQTLRVRRTDRRTVSDEPVPAEVLPALTAAAEAAGCRLHLLDRDQVIELAVAVGRAQQAQQGDERLAEEMARWVGGDRSEGVGIPAASLPEEVPLTTVADRDFGVRGTLSAGAGHDRAASYGVLFGSSDEPVDWLRGGEALSALWLTATEQAVSVLPLSGPVEIPFTRQALRRMVGDVGHPFLAVRLGTLDPTETAPPHTPRLPAGQVIDVVET